MAENPPRHSARHQALAQAIAGGKWGPVRALALALLQENPTDITAWTALGDSLYRGGRRDEAITAYQSLLQHHPDHAETHYKIGSLWFQVGNSVRAEAALLQALTHDPDNAEGWHNLGNMQLNSGRLAEAEHSYRRSLSLRQNYVDTLCPLAITLEKAKKFDDAIAVFRQALVLAPDMMPLYENLSSLLINRCLLAEAETLIRQALDRAPTGYNTDRLHKNLLFTLEFSPDHTPAEIYAGYQVYTAHLTRDLPPPETHYANDPDPERPLKIGYFSSEFRRNQMRFFLDPLLAHHDQTQFYLYAYSDSPIQDATTDHYKNYFTVWHNTAAMERTALARLIREDGIDLLIGASSDAIFAFKPAPISAYWWISSGTTTGFGAIDHILLDSLVAPDGSQPFFAESLWPLDGNACVYQPPADDMGPISPSPAQSNGYVTFCSLTHLYRINARVIALWSRILHRLGTARLILNSESLADHGTRNQLAAAFAAHGIGPERLEMGYDSPPWDLYRRADLLLDTFPRNGGTSLLEALYMGLPCITLAGRPGAGRLGAAHLTRSGHPEWVATSEDEYAEKVITLASDPARLAQIRATLREDLTHSPMMDYPAFAHKMAMTYRQMWRQWCTMQKNT